MRKQFPPRTQHRCAVYTLHIFALVSSTILTPTQHGIAPTVSPHGERRVGGGIAEGVSSSTFPASEPTDVRVLGELVHPFLMPVNSFYPVSM